MNQITRTSIALARQGVNHIIIGNRIMVQALSPMLVLNDVKKALGLNINKMDSDWQGYNIRYSSHKIKLQNAKRDLKEVLRSLKKLKYPLVKYQSHADKELTNDNKPHVAWTIDGQDIDILYFD